MITTNEMIDQFNKYYDPESMSAWMKSKFLVVEGIMVPEYIYNNTVDPNDHNTEIFHRIIKNENEFRGKTFVDLGSCAGINNILLTRRGFKVIGIDNRISSLNASLYVMMLNSTYYKVELGDHTDIPKMEYDVLLINQMSYLPNYKTTIEPLIESESSRGKEVIVRM